MHPLMACKPQGIYDLPGRCPITSIATQGIEGREGLTGRCTIQMMYNTLLFRRYDSSRSRIRGLVVGGA